jgi:hypothetical protein
MARAEDFKSEAQIKRENELFPDLRDKFEAQGMNIHAADRKAMDEAERIAQAEEDAKTEKD